MDHTAFMQVAFNSISQEWECRLDGHWKFENPNLSMVEQYARNYCSNREAQNIFLHIDKRGEQHGIR